MNRSTRPIVLLAFADPRRDLDNLKKESSGIRDLFWRFDDVVEVIILDHPTLMQITQTFQRYRNRIVAFHYGGHANGLELLLEDVQGDTQVAGALGFAQLLGHQSGLKLVFLNGCSTEGQAEALRAADVPCVIATSRAINDEVATQFAIVFYGALASGADIQAAFGEASATTQSAHGDQTRALYGRKFLDQQPAGIALPVPWNLHSHGDQINDWTFELESRRRRRGAKGATAAETAMVRHLQTLLDRVKQFWVTGLLDSSLQRSERIELAMADCSDVVADSWQSVDIGALPPTGFVESGDRVIDVFQRTRQSLMILGHPGAGKTTALLELTAGLVDWCETESDQPVPVVLHLSTWNSKFGSLVDWIEDEMSRKYHVASKHGRRFVDTEQLILMLDGLDEIAENLRDGCVEAINDFLDYQGVPGIVVCCRVDEFNQLVQPVRLAGAICLQPLSHGQIRSALSDGRPASVTLLNQLDQHADLLNLARSPLIFGIMREAFNEVDSQESMHFESQHQCQEMVFDRYIDRMIRTRSKETDSYTPQECLAGLHRLAKIVQSKGESIFMIENLQPTDLTSPWSRFAYSVSVSLIFGTLSGLFTTIFFWTLAGISNDSADALDHGLGWCVTPMLMVWFVGVGLLEPCFEVPKAELASRMTVAVHGMKKAMLFLAFWLMMTLAAYSITQHVPMFLLLVFTGVLASAMVGAYGRSQEVFAAVRPVEAVGMSVGNSARGMFVGMLVGVGVWLIHGFWNKTNLHFWYQPDGAPSVGRWIYLIVLTTLGIEGGGITGGMVPATIEGKTRLNQGMRLSLISGLKVGIAASLTLGVTVFLIAMLIRQRTTADAVSLGLSIGLLAFFCVGSWFGGFECLKHVVLRTVMRFSGQLPPGLPRFLQQARRYRLMHRVGGGFMFLHRTLQEHFAASTPVFIDRSRPADPPQVRP